MTKIWERAPPPDVSRAIIMRILGFLGVGVRLVIYKEMHKLDLKSPEHILLHRIQKALTLLEMIDSLQPCLTRIIREDSPWRWTTWQ